MVKKSVVLIQGSIIFLLWALLFGQLHMTPSAARHIDRSHPLWFMHPWRPGSPAPTGSAAEPQPAPAAPATDEAKLTEVNRRYILAPVPALNSVVTDLEAKDLEATGPVLIPGQQVQSPAPARKRTPRPAATRKPAVAGPIRLTGLTVIPTADGANIRISTSSPAERMALFTFTSPPRMTLELYGQFANYSQSIVVPQNQIFQSLTTEVSPGKLRISGTLLTPKAYVVPVTTSSRNSFTVGLTLNPDGQPDFVTKH